MRRWYVFGVVALGGYLVVSSGSGCKPQAPPGPRPSGPYIPPSPGVSQPAATGVSEEAEEGPTPTPARRKLMVSTLAGSGLCGSADGRAGQAQFGGPTGVEADADGNVYVADPAGNRIRFVSGGNVTTLAGTGAPGYKDGPATGAMFNRPYGVALDANGNVYVADRDNHRIRVVSNGVVTTLAGCGTTGPEGGGFANGKVGTAQFRFPSGLDFDPQGRVYVADSENHRIRIIFEGRVETFAGQGRRGFRDGSIAEAMFNYPTDVAVDGQGIVYVADRDNHCIRRISGGKVITLAGTRIPGLKNGPCAEAQFSCPTGVALDFLGNLYVAEWGTHRIRKVNLATHTVKTLAGSGNVGQYGGGFRDGAPSQALFNWPFGATVDPQENVYVADTNNCRVRKISYVQLESGP